MTTKLVLEINDEQKLKTLLEFLKLIKVEVLKKEEDKITGDNFEKTMEFYNRFNFDLSNFKFDRDEANER